MYDSQLNPGLQTELAGSIITKDMNLWNQVKRNYLWSPNNYLVPFPMSQNKGDLLCEPRNLRKDRSISREKLQRLSTGVMCKSIKDIPNTVK